MTRMHPNDCLSSVICPPTGRRALWVTVGLVAVGALGFACAGDVDEVDRVQPGRVAKAALLNGSWYYRRTVVDAPETLGPYASIGTGDLFTIERIRWDIQEEHLYAYRDYEYVPGSDGAEDPGALSDYRGTPVAAFPITKHFDIIYEYNPETGEKTNVRVEDESDRQWWQRDYMRVDWSKNDNPSIDFILPVDFFDVNGVGGGDFYVHEDDATNPYRARVAPEVGYIDFVVNHYIQPDVYTCYTEYDFSIQDAYNCGAGEIRVRHAFLKVDEEELRTYDPLYFPDSVPLTETDNQGKVHEIADPETGEVLREPIFERFGYYRLERLTWDDQRGLTESGRLYRIFRFDIWEKSRDEAGNLIAYRDRTIDPIVYYTNWDFPEELRGAAEEVGAEWNRVFKETVASLQGREFEDGICDNNGGADPDCAIADVFIVKQNSCNRQGLHNYLTHHRAVRDKVEAAMERAWPGADAVEHDLLDNWCAATEYFSRDLDDAFTWQQEGDPRYNLLNYITNITPSSFAGYGPMLADPISGRIICATANLMGWTLEASTTRTLEYVDYINGELELWDMLTGDNLPPMLADGSYDPKAHTFAIEEARKNADRSVSPEQLDALAARMQALGGTHAARMVPLDNSAHFAERIARVRGTDIERDFLIRPEDMMLASHGEWYPGMSISDELWEQASFFTRRQEMLERRRRTEKLFEEHTFMPMAHLDDVLVGLAKRLKEMQLDRQQRRLYLLRAIFKSVALHEIGHNIGLRHNFEGSMDAMNYPRTFWDIETLGLSDQEKMEAGQPEFMYSSIMDYHGKVNADFQGLGPWDAAAVKFGYGQIIEQFADPSVAGGDTLRKWLLEHDYRELLLDSGVDHHEDNHPPYFSSADQLYSRQDVVWDWNTTRDHVEVSNLLAREVPYMFCSDDYAQLTPTCRRFDFGANQREVQEAARISYKNYFIFTRFLRNRLVIDWNSALARGPTTFANTMLTYRHLYRNLSLDHEGYGNTDAAADMATATAMGLNLMSEVIASPQPTEYHRCVLEHLFNVQRPVVVCDPANSGAECAADFDCLEVDGVHKCATAASEPARVNYFHKGYIEWDPLVDVRMGFGPDHDPDLGYVENCYMDEVADVSLGDGFPLFFGFSEDYVSWTFTYLGTYWDKIAALEQLTDPYAYFLRTNQEEDIRSYSVSLSRLYPNELNDILLGLIEMDHRSLSTEYCENSDTLLGRTMVEVPEPDNPNLCDGEPVGLVPAMVRNMQLYAVLFGMAYLSSPFDEALDFSKHARVALKGSAEDFPAFDTVPAGDRAECTLPEAGLTYRAMRTASIDSRIDIAFNFVNRCADEVEKLERARQAYMDEQAILESLDPLDSDYAAQEDETENKRLEWERADSDLRSTEQTLMFMRRLHRLYEHNIGY